MFDIIEGAIYTIFVIVFMLIPTGVVLYGIVGVYDLLERLEKAEKIIKEIKLKEGNEKALIDRYERRYGVVR